MMKISMRWATIIGSILLVWGANLIIIPSSYFNSQHILLRHSRDIMVNISDLTMEQSYNHLYKARSAANLTKLLLSSRVVTHESAVGFGALEHYFFDQLATYPHLAGIYFGTPDGDFFYVNRDNSRIKNGFRTKIIKHGSKGRTCRLTWRDSNYKILAQKNDPSDTYDPRQRPWYRKAIRNNHIVWTDPYIFFTSQRPGITIAGPSYNAKGRLQGVVGVDIDIAELSTFIGKLRVGKSGEAFMLNRNGDVIAYHDIKRLIVHTGPSGTTHLASVDELDNPVITKAFATVKWHYDKDGNMRLTKPVFTSFLCKGKRYTAMFTPFADKKLPWVIGVYIPDDDYLGEIKHSRKLNIIYTVLLSGIASLLAMAFARSITRPVVALQEAARAIEKNDMTPTIKADSIFQEIQETADGFARMQTSIINYRQELEEREKLHAAITSTANDAIILIDQDDNISYWNPAAEKIFGFSSKAVMGANIFKTIMSSDDEGEERGATLRAHIQRLNDSGRAFELMAVNAQGTKIPIEFSAAHLTIKGHQHEVVIIRDISERKRHEMVKKQLVNDLHDGIGGNLTNIKLLAEMNAARTTDKEDRRVLENIADICQDSMLEIRNYMDSLDGREINWPSWLADLRQYCFKTMEAHGINFEMHHVLNPKACRPSSLLAMNMFKIIREGLTNIIKHAHAGKVRLDIIIDGETLRLNLADDGGAEAGDIERNRHGRGILSMRARCRDLGGELSLKAENGLNIDIVIPLKAGSEHLVCRQEHV